MFYRFEGIFFYKIMSKLKLQHVSLFFRMRRFGKTTFFFIFAEKCVIWALILRINVTNDPLEE